MELATTMFGRKKREEPIDTHRCSFCRKSQREVCKLVAGPDSLFICDECVDICVNIIHKPDHEGSVLTRDESLEGEGPVGVAVLCKLCEFETLVSHGLLIEGRGVLCESCSEAVREAIAAHVRVG